MTDSAGKVLYDTRETNDALGEYSFYTEIVQALLGNDVFSSSYPGRGLPQPGGLAGAVPEPDHRRRIRIRV